jgi:hypothetical protein
MPRRPDSLQDLVEIIGEGPAARLVRDFGGRTDVTVHSIPRPDSPLAQCLGLEAYAALRARCAGECLTIPLAGTGRAARFASTVRQERAQNTVATIARRHGVHMRTVWRYLQTTSDTRQISLDL